jgi:hypothetical protein
MDAPGRVVDALERDPLVRKCIREVDARSFPAHAAPRIDELRLEMRWVLENGHA